MTSRSGPAKSGGNGKNATTTLSRSKLELFLDCSACFWIDRVRGVARPDGAVYSLNLAVDALLKKEFDGYRLLGEPHPLMREWGIDAIPYFDPLLNDWREASRGVRTTHEASGITLFGAVDDVWENANGELIVVDYKCTGRPFTGQGLPPVRDSYRRQLEVYQWILRQMGYRVSQTGYLVIAAPIREHDAFNAALQFSMSIVPVHGNSDWIPDALLEIRRCLDQEHEPPSSAECDWCNYVSQRTKPSSGHDDL